MLDNSAFASSNLWHAVVSAKQDLILCRVEVHWQNGIVERYIGSIMHWDWTMLLHAMA